MFDSRHLAREKLETGDTDSAVRFYKCAADAGDFFAQFELVEMCASLDMTIWPLIVVHLCLDAVSLRISLRQCVCSRPPELSTGADGWIVPEHWSA